MAIPTIRAPHLGAASPELLDPDGESWMASPSQAVALVPTPLALVQAVSPYLAASQGHGRIARLTLQAAHNALSLSVRLVWEDPQRDHRIEDLNRFADAGAVMFPLVDGADPVTMGSPEKPVNTWLWRADREEPYDVIAEGYGTSRRRPGGESGLQARASYSSGHWTLVLQRPLAAPGRGFVPLEPGKTSGIAVALWEGSNRERAGQKAISGAFRPLVLGR